MTDSQTAFLSNVSGIKYPHFHGDVSIDNETVQAYIYCCLILLSGVIESLEKITLVVLSETWFINCHADAFNRWELSCIVV